MPGLQNFAPNFSIPPDAFKKDQDAYAQILPMLLAGQQQAQQRRQQQMVQQLLGQYLQPQGQPPPPMQGPQMPGVGTTPGMIPPTSGMGAPSPQQPAAPQDPMKLIVGMMQADPAMAQQAFPAFVKAAMAKQKGGGMTDFQTASLAEKQKEFASREKMQGNIQDFKEKIDQAILSLRKAGLNVQADRLETQKKEWLAQHFILGYMGMGPDVGGTSGDGGDETSSGGDDGWGDVQVTP